ncbi:uncharacterized protein LOC100825960 isoform X1 [Brachypodium distachyon]|uniref:Uncharacterized protein n=1 Tax=Brachypodium distachyon TaxID=15368 RepID=A0A2K2CT59_BRADI|nr:uncharacterized protein LOC100825960 isoform X1 [Brachypodium distachyon]PNT65203.1 hypothetical protein BRADI_4g38680v3 [Brachypodium distachyon]|eukprot:XP_010238538.1 uncharacterized protein LOC100825960 isoform X1 [Brachypodium distachyon]
MDGAAASAAAAAAAESGLAGPAANGEKPQEQQFDPSRSKGLSSQTAFASFARSVIGIIKRKALIKELAAAYHAECVTCCKELLQLQRKWEEEQYVEAKMPEEPKRPVMKPSKRRRK